MITGCGSVGRAVATDTRDPRFESSRRQFNFLSSVFKLCWKDEKIKKKRSGMAHFEKC